LLAGMNFSNMQAVIFDLNGTVLEDEDIYGSAFRKVLEYLGKKVDEKYPQMGGIGVEENWPKLIAKYNIQTEKSYEELALMTQDFYIKDISKIKVRSGFTKLVDDLKEKGILVALATSNTWSMTDKVLSELNIEKYFDFITTKEEVEFNKPAPDIFLITADKLGVDPENCIVVEDSLAGVESAKDAGMKVVALTWNPETKDELKENADFTIESYNELTYTKILSLLEM
jgi:16S rRNA pseudouridine516 synthase